MLMQQVQFHHEIWVVIAYLSNESSNKLTHLHGRNILLSQLTRNQGIGQNLDWLPH